ncbi:aroma-sacti cluster domain-containing protein [Streptomyces hydrogenans]|uniref:aroma-sacti cluster domain-containing protein n=1 Tax=Streptomyces hydrogenans TaxID=1873719 RepID=UPI003632F869
MSFDALNSLRECGLPVDLVSEAQRQVLAALDEDEVAVLRTVKSRLDAVAGEVEAQDFKLL